MFIVVAVVSFSCLCLSFFTMRYLNIYVWHPILVYFHLLYANRLHSIICGIPYTSSNQIKHNSDSLMKCDFQNGTVAESNSYVNICCLMDASNFNWKLIEVECEHWTSFKYMVAWCVCVCVVMLCEWHSNEMMCAIFSPHHSHFVNIKEYISYMCKLTTIQHPILTGIRNGNIYSYTSKRTIHMLYI